MLEDARRGVVVEQVGGEEADALAELVGERAQALLAPGDEHQRPAGLAREPPRGRLADAARGAGDEHHARRGRGVTCVWHRCPRCRSWDRSLGRLAFQIPIAMSTPAPSELHATSARKREALELFRGLPRRYDALSAALSFWQDPRWRRALVSAVAPQPGQRVLDVATGTGMVAAELLARCDCSVVGIDQSAAMLAGARARFATRLAHRAARGPGGGAAVRRRELRRAYVHLPAALRRRPRGDDARASARACVRAAASPRSSSACRRSHPRGGPGGCTPRSGCPRSGGLASREWAEVGRFLGPSIRGFYAATRSSGSSATGRRPAWSTCVVRRMSLGGGVVMSARRAGADGV